MSPHQQLGQRVSAALKQRPEEQDLEAASPHVLHAWEQQLRAHSAGSWPRWLRLGLLPVAAVAGAFIWMLYLPQSYQVSEQHRPGVVGEWLQTGVDEHLTLAFQDQSLLVLSANGRMHVERLRHSGGEVVLHQGRAHMRVPPHSGLRWDVRAGPYLVRIVGTELQLSWSPQEQYFTLEMEEGAVQVQGPLVPEMSVPAGFILTAMVADQRVEIRPRTSAPQSPMKPMQGTGMPMQGEDMGNVNLAVTPLSVPRVGSVDAGVQPPKANPARTPASASSRADWRTWAERGEYDRAYALFAPGLSALLASASAADLMAMGDAARLSGHPAEAEEAYRAVRLRFARTPSAASAAFLLGKLAFDHQRDFQEAARWFELSVVEAPKGRFGEEAAGRLMEAHERKGDLQQAWKSAQRYLESFPEGAYRAHAQALLRNAPAGKME